MSSPMIKTKLGLGAADWAARVTASVAAARTAARGWGGEGTAESFFMAGGRARAGGGGGGEEGGGRAGGILFLGRGAAPARVVRCRRSGLVFSSQSEHDGGHR